MDERPGEVAAVVAVLAQNVVGVVIDAMVLNVVVLAIPLTFLIRLSADRCLPGACANGTRRTALLWGITAGLLIMGLWSTRSVLLGGQAFVQGSPARRVRRE